MTQLNEYEEKTIVGGEAITLTAIMAILAIGIVTVICYKLFFSDKGKTTPSWRLLFLMGVNEEDFFGLFGCKPREKAEISGMESLSDAELLALILETGTKEENVMRLSSRLLFERGGMIGLFQSDENLETVKGIGRAKKYRILAIREIMRRLPFEREEKAKSADDVYQLTRNIFMGSREERLFVLYLSADRKIIKKEEFRGLSVSEISFPVMTILHHAISSFSKGVIICHNHPSGNLEPSEADRYSMVCLREKLKLANIVLIDSIIVTENGYYSFRNKKETCLFENEA